MGSSTKIMSGVFWSIVANIVNALYGFIMIPILINYFGKAEYGLIGLAQSVNAYMQLMDMGLTSTNVRYFSNWLAKGDNEKVRKLFSTCTAFYGVIGLINALLLLAILFFSKNIFNVTPEQDIVLKHLLAILAISAFVNWFTSCYNQIIQATENVAWTQKRLLLTKVLMIITLVITVYRGLSVTSYFFLTILCNWLILPWVVKKIREVAPMVNFKAKFDKAIFKEILPYTLNIFSFTIFSFSYQNLRTVFLGIQGTVESVTDQKVIMGIVGLVGTVSSVFLSTLLPSSSKVIANNNMEAYYRIAYSGTKYIMIFMGFCVFGIMAISKDLLILYVGEDFLYLIPALYIQILILLSNHILGISSLILGGSNIKPLSMMTAVSSIVALLVCWFFIPDYQVMGVAIACLVYTVLQMLFYYFYYWPVIMKINSWKIFATIVLPVSIFSCMGWYLVRYIPDTGNHWKNIFFIGFSFTLYYILFLLAFLSDADKKFFENLLKKK